MRLFGKMRTFLTNYTAWLIICGFYLLIRFYGTDEYMDWGTSKESFLIIWLLSALTLNVIYLIGQHVSDLKKVRRHSYGYIILIRVGAVSIGILIVLLLTRIFALLQGRIHISELLPTYFERLMGTQAIVVILFLVFGAFIISFIKQVSVMIGPRVLINLLLGKYHFPKEENRIFMFIDLKDSTAYAEQLGHLKFCRLIQDCFHDMTESVTKHEVEIYQYVGDEAILTWEVDRGIKNNNCINVFFEFEKALIKRKDYYLNNYNLIPEFKAGVNSGPVTVTEIGDIKRDIAYLSDVLNTASRIEGQCNALNSKLLISGYVKELLNDDENIVFKHHKDVKLKGKEEDVDIFSVVLNGS